jgi:hypothetical protein
MPRADATELAPKKSARTALSRSHWGAGGLSAFRQRKQESLHFFGEAPERRPWAIKREDRPAAFAGRFQMEFPFGIHVSAYTGEYPIPPSRYRPTRPVTEFEKSTGRQRENFEGN